jgi:hypothetical protein
MKLTRWLCAISSLVLLTPAIWAQDGLRGALSRYGFNGRLQHAFGQQIVAADFDEDQQPDGAVLLDAGQVNGQRSFRIEMHLTAGNNTGLSFSSAESAISISALDVNADGAPDIVVEQTFTHKRLQVWLNDGHGSFRQVSGEDYPSQIEARLRLRARIPGQIGAVLWLPSRFGSEVAHLRSTPFSAIDSSGVRNLCLEVQLAHSAPRAPNPPRGPPSLSL